MTDSIIERGARALAKAQSGVDDWEALDEAFQQNLKDHVRAVLGAMREPSGAMLDVGQYEVSSESPFPDDARSDARDCWHTMIDTALQDD